MIRDLAAEYSYVRPVWLARNFGQHAATLAGMSSTSADWIVTMDEDGQHDPAAIGQMLDTALSTRSPLVYAAADERGSHSAFRNLASRVAHRAAGSWARAVSATSTASGWCSVRSAAGLAAYCGGERLPRRRSHLGRQPYSDVPGGNAGGARAALGLLDSRPRIALLADGADLRNAPAAARRGLRCIPRLCGIRADGMGRVGEVHRPGRRSRAGRRSWSSCSVTSGGTLLSLGIVAEYLGIAAKSAMGKPLYLVVSDPPTGPWAGCRRRGFRIGQAAPSCRIRWSPPPGRRGDASALLDQSGRMDCSAATSRRLWQQGTLAPRSGAPSVPLGGTTAETTVADLQSEVGRVLEPSGSARRRPGACCGVRVRASWRRQPRRSRRRLPC